MPSTFQKDKAILSSLVQFAFILSKDPSTKVGAAIVSHDFNQMQFSYNGLPSGIPDTLENWEKCVKDKLVIHAEENSLIRCPFNKKGAVLYCTLTPCLPCLRLIAGSGVGEIVFFDSRPNLSNEYQMLLKTFKDVRRYEPDEILVPDFLEEMLYKGYLG